jgi:hypothetical protein
VQGQVRGGLIQEGGPGVQMLVRDPFHLRLGRFVFVHDAAMTAVCVGEK